MESGLIETTLVLLQCTLGTQRETTRSCLQLLLDIFKFTESSDKEDIKDLRYYLEDCLESQTKLHSGEKVSGFEILLQVRHHLAEDTSELNLLVESLFELLGYDEPSLEDDSNEGVEECIMQEKPLPSKSEQLYPSNFKI